MDCLPQAFEFVASPDNKTWYNPSIDRTPMSGNEIRKHEYNSGISKYFKLRSIGFISHSYCKGYGMDVDEIELFGTLIDDDSLLVKHTCQTLYNPKLFLFLIDYLLMSK